MLWFASLASCPLGLVALDRVYPNVASHPPPWPPTKPPERWADGLVWGQVWVSLFAALPVMVLFRRWPGRLLAWLGIVLVLALTALFGLGVIMAKTGKYL